MPCLRSGRVRAAEAGVTGSETRSERQQGVSKRLRSVILAALMYFEDLSFYTTPSGRVVPQALNVGWLDRLHPFDHGNFDRDLLQRLTVLALHKPSRRTRGYHQCGFCTEYPIAVRDGDHLRHLGSAEIWIPRGPDEFFASPNMLPHYIDAHGYRPPEAFITALRALDV